MRQKMKQRVKQSVEKLTPAVIFVLLAAQAVAQSFAGSEPLPPVPPANWFAQGHSLDEWDRFRYDYSGTRGRLGLGASPFHPEGPGNFSSPSR